MSKFSNPSKTIGQLVLDLERAKKHLAQSRDRLQQVYSEAEDLLNDADMADDDIQSAIDNLSQLV
jgi:ABC-type transporter Mla subunit MlaD